ncbi:MAG: glycosyltransferase family 2 protein [Syntrophobacteraceae bacterium]
MTHPDFSILIPLYNEEECLIPNIRQLLLFFRERGLDGEIILGSNGSTDSTAFIGDLLSRTEGLPVEFFHLEHRGAVGEVFRRALPLASSPYLISIDADLSVDLEFVTGALTLLEKHDVVVGSKQAGSQKRSVVRRLGSGLYIFLAQLLLDLPYDDYSIGAKAYRISKIRPLAAGISRDTNYVLDILLKSSRAGLPVAILPVACRDFRKSRFNLLQEGLTRLSHLLITCLQVVTFTWADPEVWGGSD